MDGSNLSGMITSPFFPIGLDHGSVSRPMVSTAKDVPDHKSNEISTLSAQNIQSDHFSKMFHSIRFGMLRLEATQQIKRVCYISNDILVQAIAYYLPCIKPKKFLCKFLIHGIGMLVLEKQNFCYQAGFS
jgi:hypothetical protein